MKTVAELREFLETLDGNMPIVKMSLNPEHRGVTINGIYATIDKYISEKEMFVDTFDYTEYCEVVYKRNKKGTECLYIG